MGRPKIDFIVRFFSYIKKNTNSECEEWQAKINKNTNYGYLWKDGKNKLAHRIAWNIYYGEIPDKFCVMHICDNRKCVKKEHLMLGSHQDNMNDMVKKNRAAWGERNRNSNLSNIERLNILEMWKAGQTQINISKKLDINKNCVYSIIESFIKKDISLNKNKRRKITEEIRAKFKLYRDQGLSYFKIGKLFEVTAQTVINNLNSSVA